MHVDSGDFRLYIKAMSLISVVIPCYNEEDNVVNIADKTRGIFKSELPNDDYEIIFIDNGSSDKTIERIKTMCSADKKIKLIANVKNYGQLISPYYGMLQANGDAVIPMVCDFQDPPENIPSLVEKWKKGKKIVLAIPKKTKEGYTLFKKIYYKLINFFAREEQIPNFHSYGIYDREVQEALARLNDKSPYFRGQILELNFEKELVYYTPNKRESGKSTNNFFSLYTVAIEGLVSTSIIPLRLVSLIGLFSSLITILVGVSYFLYKILHWDTFEMGMAPWVIALFLFASVQLFFLGLIGEYLLINQFKNQASPFVVEKERINFG